ncbi:MAG: hypothetical protein DRJ44_05345, partial [Thermoprotei archaeon]
QILVYNFEEVVKVLRSNNLNSLAATLLGLEHMDRVVDVHKLSIEKLGIEKLALEELEWALRWERSVHLQDLRIEWEDVRRYVRDKPYSKWLRSSKFLQRKLGNYVAENLETIYKLFLVLKHLNEK